MKKVKFINSYSFIFSPRPGTPAANMKEIDKQVAKDRLKVFQKVSDDIKKNYRKKLINSTAKVLFENKIKNGNKFFGRDEYFNSVIVESNDNLIGKTKVVKFNECNQNTLFGNLISDMKKREECAA